jgi:hypothetical protein
VNTDFHIAASPSATLGAFPWVAVSFGMYWVSLLGHEGAHFGMARLLYSPTDLAAGIVPAWPQLFVVGAGPRFTLLLLILCASYAVGRGAKASASVTPLAYAAASRLALVAPGTLLGTAVNDERTVGRLLHVVPVLLWSGEALVATVALVIVSANVPPGMERRSTAWMVLGIILGWMSAFTVGRAVGLPV